MSAGENPPATCAWCERRSHIRQGRIWLCAAHYRISSMRTRASRDGKPVPTRQGIEALVPHPFVCGCCARGMTWLRESGASRQATLQHDRNGGLRIICLGCNTRHAMHPGDSFYDIPAGQKRCGGCDQVLPVDAFAVDRSRPIGRKGRCRACASADFKKWSKRHAA
jgi:hypothetical protein